MQGAFLVVKSSNLEVSGEPHRVQRVQQDSKCSCRSALMHCQVTVSVWKWQCKDSVTACSLGQINKVVVEQGRGGEARMTANRSCCSVNPCLLRLIMGTSKNLRDGNNSFKLPFHYWTKWENVITDPSLFLLMASKKTLQCLPLS